MAIWIVAPVQVRAQNVAAAPSPLFAEDAPLSLTIMMDFDAVLDDRDEENEYQPAALYVEGSDASHGIGIKTRGFFRLLYLDCDVPPLRLNFKKGEVAGTVFEGQDKLKLVTHCHNGSDRFQQYVFQEYLIYRAYNLLTEASFLTRLVRITYRDAANRHKPVTAFGFLIEDEERMAERNGADLVEGTFKIHPGATQQDAMTRLAAFQYMIGNTDWTVSTRHNIRLMFVESTRSLVAVPYDFDWAGLISAPYARPFHTLNLRSVRQRRFMGPCRSDAEFEQALASFASARDQIVALFREFTHLEEQYAEDSAEYLEEFFEDIKQPVEVPRDFAATCI